VSWTDTQWKRVRQAVTEEANRVRVASSFLPTYGPLPPSTQVVPSEVVDPTTLTVDDVATTRLVELWVEFELSEQQVAEVELESALLLFRRAANIVARGEDWTIFNGRPRLDRTDHVLPGQGLPTALCVRGGRRRPRAVLPDDPGASGLLYAPVPALLALNVPLTAQGLVGSIAASVAALEQVGHLAPFFCVLGDAAFVAAQSPNAISLVLPSDRIAPFLGRPLIRSGTVPRTFGVLVSLAGAPIDLAVAVDAAPQFLNVSNAGRYRFRVYERFALRIKEVECIVRLEFN
jgi:uncharacterized linocin/CFP29 family protein